MAKEEEDAVAQEVVAVAVAREAEEADGEVEAEDIVRKTAIGRDAILPGTNAEGNAEAVAIENIDVTIVATTKTFRRRPFVDFASVGST